MARRNLERVDEKQAEGTQVSAHSAREYGRRLVRDRRHASGPDRDRSFPGSGRCRLSSCSFCQAVEVREALMPAQAERIVYTVEEAAERLGVGCTLVCALVRRGDIESIAIGRLRRIPCDALDDFVSRMRCLNHSAAADTVDER
jgi:excisionase family DNA binding protein